MAYSLAAGVEAGQLYPRRCGIFRPLTIAERVHFLKSIPSYNCDAPFASFPDARQKVCQVRPEVLFLTTTMEVHGREPSVVAKKHPIS